MKLRITITETRVVDDIRWLERDNARRAIGRAHGEDRTIPCEKLHRGPACPGLAR